jgi:hypothetical protein
MAAFVGSVDALELGTRVFEPGKMLPSEMFGSMCATRCIYVQRKEKSTSINCQMMREKASRNRFSGTDFKPPRAALLKRYCCEHIGKRR